VSDIPIEIQIKAAAVEIALKELASDEVRTKALGSIGRSLLTKIQLGFRTGSDPWGGAWKPLVLRKGQPLRNTGALQRSMTYKVEGDTVKIGTNKQVSYRGKTHSLGNIHQYGRTIKPIPPNKYLRVPVGGSADGNRPTAYARLRSAIIPPRPFLPLRPGDRVDLPGEWSLSALNAIAKALKLS